jgi:hypothetical protein
VTIEPWVGGRVYATHSDLGQHNWGQVTTWEPGHRVAHTFTLAQDPDDPSEVAALFKPGEQGVAAPFGSNTVDGAGPTSRCARSSVTGL